MTPRFGRARRSPPRTVSRRPMPSLWRMPLNTGYRSSYRPQPWEPQPMLPQLLVLGLLAPMRCLRKETATSIRPRASTRACSSLLHRAAIATGSIFAMLANKRVSSAAANNPIRIIFATCNRGRSAAKPAMSSRCRSAARITARSIAPATSSPGGRRPGSTLSRSPVSSGGKPGSMIRKFAVRRRLTIASASDDASEARSEQVAIGRAADGQGRE